MEPTTIGLMLGAVAGVAVIPFVIIYCASCVEKEANEPPQLTAVNKTESLVIERRDSSTRSSSNSKKKNGSKKKSKEENGTTPNGTAPSETVIVNVANIEEQPENTGGSQISVSLAGGNTYEELDNVRDEAATVALRNTSSNQRISQSVIIVSEHANTPQTNRHSLNSGHARINSQERALPEIPPVPSGGPPPVPDSPSNRRALPDLPTQFDEDGDPYDHLDRTIPPQHIKPKSASSKTSHPSPPTLAVNPTLQAAGSSEPLYQEAGSESGGVIYAQVEENGTENDENKTEQVVKKKDGGYTVVKKLSHGAIASPTKTNISTEREEDPVYSEAPPVPEKLYDLEEIRDQGAHLTPRDSAAAGGGDSQENSGSGYYSSVNYAGLPPPDNNFPLNQHNSANPGSGDSYDVLGAREPLATVRARALREAAGNDEDYCYVEMDDSRTRQQPNGASNAPRPQQGASDVYAEIDNPQNRLLVDEGDYSTVANPPLPNSNNEEEDYAECGNPDPPTTRPTFRIKVTEGLDSENDSGSGYATVNYQPPTNGTTNERPPIETVNPIAAAADQPSTSGSTRQRPPANHVYQEINEVKKSKKSSEKKKPDKSS